MMTLDSRPAATLSYDSRCIELLSSATQLALHLHDYGTSFYEYRFIEKQPVRRQPEEHNEMLYARDT